MKLHLVLPLTLKSGHLAAVVFLKLTVRNVDADGNLIVACFEALSFCGKLQVSFLSPVFDVLSLQQGLSPQLSCQSRGRGAGAVSAAVRGRPWSEDARAQLSFATEQLCEHGMLPILFEPWFSYV